MAARQDQVVRLHIVTGKGGTGKTTVAAAMAMALASGGHRVLLVEVEGRQGISQTFDVPPLATEEIRIAGAAGGGEVWGLSVDAKATVEFYRQHRAERLDEIRAALKAGDTQPRQVVERVYADVPKEVWPYAELSVRAQLDYLQYRSADGGRNVTE